MNSRAYPAAGVLFYAPVSFDLCIGVPSDGPGAVIKERERFSASGMSKSSDSCARLTKPAREIRAVYGRI